MAITSEAELGLRGDNRYPDPFRAWVCRTQEIESNESSAGYLAGLHFGVKDVIVTESLPTRFGSRVPAKAFSELLALGDAACVRLLRQHGAKVAGKTVTAELATYNPGPTVNPIAPEHTPGGSSSGSAAAVGAGDVPLALATQTAGSVIRPASFCGVMGFKPSHGRYSTEGILTTSDTLDTLGLIGANAQVLAQVDAVLSGSAAVSGQHLPGRARRLVLYRTSYWLEAMAATRSLIEEQFENWRPLFAESGIRAPQAAIDSLFEVQRVIHCGELAENLGWLVDRYPSELSDSFKNMIAEGRAVTGPVLDSARSSLRAARERVENLVPPDEIWVTPAVKGPAPALVEGTGDPMFCRSWTALGVPCATLPALGKEVSGGLPVGVQILASTGKDELLLDTLALLASHNNQTRKEKV